MASRYINADDVPTFGGRVKLHANLNEACLSVQWKDSGGVRWMKDVTVHLMEPKFHVQPAGHNRIVERNSREVVARVSGVVTGIDKTLKTFKNDRLTFTTPKEWFGWRELSYNPIERPLLNAFHDVQTLEPVNNGDCLELIVAHNWRFGTATNVRMWGLFE